MAPKKTRKIRVKNNIKPFQPKNAYDFYKIFFPITESFKTSHPDIYTSMTNYKGLDYHAMNTFLNKLKYKISKSNLSRYESDKKSDLAWIKSNSDVIQKSRFKNLYNKLKGDDLETLAMKRFLLIVGQIENIRQMFTLYKVPKSYKLPTLYRGIYVDKDREDPFATSAIGDTVTINQIVSCSLSPSVALSFQTCSENGPCCFMRLKVDSDVKFIPSFWSFAESYVYAEHEVILEPFAEYTLLAKKSVRIPLEVGVKCPYNKFNKDGKITVTVYDVQVSKPKKETVKEYEKILDTIEKDIKSAVGEINIELDFSLVKN
jgi:hypothetical protein